MMPVPLTKDNFRDRVHQAADALNLKFQTTTQVIEAPEAAEIWKLLQCVEELIRKRPLPEIPSVELDQKQDIAAINESRKRGSRSNRTKIQEPTPGPD